ncbi:MAG: hypothetical protein J1E04_05295 [Alistipes sp.]|nr:hypothetical protein [Alistipes sp.]
MKIYPYKINARTGYITAAYIVVTAVLAAVMGLLYEGGYLSAWFLSFAMALVALTVLSIPRKLALSDTTLYIRCILDITEIPYSEIASVRPVGRKDMRWVLPLFGCMGFFGYYGHFIDLKNMRHIEIYASTWSNFIEITTIYEKTYYVSCPQRDELTEELRSRRPQRDSRDGI